MESSKASLDIVQDHYEEKHPNSEYVCNPEKIMILVSECAKRKLEGNIPNGYSRYDVILAIPGIFFILLIGLQHRRKC